MKSMFAIGLTFTALMKIYLSFLMNIDFQGLTIFYVLLSFDGRDVAKLPFVPISWFQGLSHRNLFGSDYTDCSFIFLYILCTMSIRQVRNNSWGSFSTAKRSTCNLI